MKCEICNHDNPKYFAEVHKPGKCPQCNCGESEIRNYNTLPKQETPDYDLMFWGDRMRGRKDNYVDIIL
jgi:hypothetical protein